MLRLDIISWGFIAALVIIGTGLLTGGRLLRRRRFRIPAVLVLVAGIVFSTAGVASGVNRYFAYLPQLGDVVSVLDGNAYWPEYADVAALSPADAEHRYPDGVTVTMNIPDKGSGFGDHDALIYLPPQYFSKPHARFPVAYLIHGSPGVPADWFRGGRAADAAYQIAQKGRPMIVVAPRMSQHWLDDPECVDGKKEKVETHFTLDVLPTIDQTLRTIRSRSARLIGGNSAGGYCALNLGLRHRDLFSTIIDMSGFTEPTHFGGLSALFGKGPAAASSETANSPDKYAGGVNPTPATRIWFDCGSKDITELKQMSTIQKVLTQRGLPAVLHVRPGGHTFHVWRPALMESLAWAAAGMDRAH